VGAGAGAGGANGCGRPEPRQYRFDVLITSYETIAAADAPDSLFLRKVPWGLLVVDEAHRLKNTKSHAYAALTGR
jgi:SNF2 family DNA or RNA helicase